MASRLGTVDFHPQKEQIVAALLAREPTRSIAKRFGITQGSLCRFSKRVVKPAVQAVSNRTHIALLENLPPPTEQSKQAEAREIASVGLIQSTADLAEKKFARYDRWIEKAEKDEKLKELALLDTAETKALTLRAQLRGEMQPTVSISFSVAVAGGVAPGSGSQAHSQVNGSVETTAEPID